MIVRRKASVEGLLERLARKRIAAPATPLSGGKEGPPGADGEDGRNAGLLYTYLTNTESSDPGSGKLKLNTEATSLRISETDGDGNALAAYIATWDDSTSTVRGHLTMRKDSNPAVFAVFSISGTVTDNGTWDTFTVAYVAGSGAFANNDVVKVEFRPKGDKGDTGGEGKEGKEGAAGAPGATGSEDWKSSVRAATTANIAIATALNNGDALDGVTLATGDRVLVKNQTTTKENGIWVVGVTPARATDADAAGELSGGTTVYVEEGTQNGGRVMRITTAGSITPGTTSHTWAGLFPKRTRGEATATFPGATTQSNVVTVTHGLGVAPTHINFTPIASEAATVGIMARLIEGSLTSTQFKMRLYGPVVISATTINFLWEALAD